jgi:hypothetical protein
MAIFAMPMRPPNLKYAKGAWSFIGITLSAAGTREDPFVDCYMAAFRPPLLGVSLALNFAAMTRPTYAFRYFMPHYDLLGPSKLSNISPLPQLQETSRPKS